VPVRNAGQLCEAAEAQPHRGGSANQRAACKTEDLPPGGRRHRLGGDAMHERVARHGGRCGEYKR